MRRLASLLVLVTAMAACGGSEPNTEAGSTTTTADLDAGWTRPCHPTDEADASRGGARGSTAFGPLGDEPSIVVHLPLARPAPEVADPIDVDRWPMTSTVRLHDGIAVAAAPPFTSDAASSTLAVVNDDGSLRWVRCFDGTVEDVVGSDDPHAGTVLVAVGAGPGNGTDLGRRWVAVAVADGRERPLDPDLDLDRVVAESGRKLLLAARDLDEKVPHELALYDLVTAEVEPVELPPTDPRITDDGPTFGFGPAGDVVLYVSGVSSPSVAGALWRSGTWVTDVAALEALPVQADFDYGRDGGAFLVSTSATGRLRWERPLRHPGLEGRSVVQDDRTVVAWTCGERQADGRCPMSVVGVDLASGKILWTRPGEHVVGVGGDGYVLLEHGLGDGDWFLHDMRTGDEVTGQHWADPGAFHEGCCDEGRYRNVERTGGTVTVLDGDEVRVWFPRDRAGPRRDVTLP